MVRTKICGITSVREALLAQQCGADAIGVLVGQIHQAPDFVSEEAAKIICRTLAPFVASVVVTHLEKLTELVALARYIPCRVLQVHSDVDPKILKEVRRRLPEKKIVGKVSVEDESAIDRAMRLNSCVDAILLDSIDRSTDRVGGTGLVHDWSISSKIVRTSTVPVILAGGLTPRNVRQAILKVKPWAVDVNSGVEKPGGQKSESLIRAFVKAARSIR